MTEILTQVAYPGTYYHAMRQGNFTIVTLFAEENGLHVSSGASKRIPSDDPNTQYGIALALKRANDAIPIEVKVRLMEYHFKVIEKYMKEIDQTLGIAAEPQH